MERTEIHPDIRNNAEGYSRGKSSRRRFLLQLTGTAIATSVLEPLLHGCSSERGSDRSKTKIEAALVKRPFIPHTEPVVRVRIAKIHPQTDKNNNGITISSDTRWIVVREAGGKRSGITLQSPINIKRKSINWVIKDKTGFGISVDGLKPVQIISDASENHKLWIGKSIYPGSLSVHPMDLGGKFRDDGAFDVINSVPVEKYLPGVLDKELYKHWHAETFAVQAIAARSFACAEAQYFAKSRHFDLTNTQASQVYGGQTQSKAAKQAVERTKGIVLTWNNTLVPGYYSSCCGGIAADAVSEIGSNPINDIPPLRARSTPDACIHAPVYRWQYERSVKDLTKRIQAYGRSSNKKTLAGLSEVVSIQKAEANPYGRPSVLSISDVQGNKANIPTIRFRAAVDYSGGGLKALNEPLLSSFVKVQIENQTATFNGRGFGHGVGMCQYGAQALSVKGLTFEEILSMYYPDSYLVPAFS